MISIISKKGDKIMGNDIDNIEYKDIYKNTNQSESEMYLTEETKKQINFIASSGLKTVKQESILANKRRPVPNAKTNNNNPERAK